MEFFLPFSDSLVLMVLFSFFQGASLNHANSAGETCLHLATSRKNDVAVKFFAENGCDVNAVTKHGETALHYAVNQNCPGIIEVTKEDVSVGSFLYLFSFFFPFLASC